MFCDTLFLTKCCRIGNSGDIVMQQHSEIWTKWFFLCLITRHEMIRWSDYHRFHFLALLEFYIFCTWFCESCLRIWTNCYFPRLITLHEMISELIIIGFISSFIGILQLFVIVRMNHVSKALFWSEFVDFFCRHFFLVCGYQRLPQSHTKFLKFLNEVKFVHYSCYELWIWIELMIDGILDLYVVTRNAGA